MIFKSDKMHSNFIWSLAITNEKEKKEKNITIEQLRKNTNHFTVCTSILLSECITPLPWIYVFCLTIQPSEHKNTEIWTYITYVQKRKNIFLKKKMSNELHVICLISHSFSANYCRKHSHFSDWMTKLQKQNDFWLFFECYSVVYFFFVSIFLLYFRHASPFGVHIDWLVLNEWMNEWMDVWHGMRIFFPLLENNY